ncbi:anthranilate phosphoribosyltransferase [Natrarchaeobius halalkaliphilus]|uniref:Anthranilate phosphoribosyltransferase n=1 Tax=Natrarchaeobius halalkaliphilus TaxID=1679091 RepID=A0A3N6M706_9EURY|nr:anthranilate phosphoribosyltransferase [Natrarchaeobius halalkaliphilus]RQG91111.1 anthranilate phosphoribosyltransferase [Natrarchaeobius halalkaliphilus]
MAQATQEFGEWPLKRLMTEVVGSGHKSADDMTREQAREAFQRILAGEPDETTLGAFWLANRWKRNTPEELAAYTDVMREESVVTGEPDCDPVDCGANYDGKHTSAVLGVGAGVVAAAAGTPVVVHSGDRVPTQKATAYKHVLDDLDVRTELEPTESAEMVDETGFGFYYQPAFNPGIDDLSDRRDQMGVRVFVNTVETVANPANADVHLGSFYHLAFAKKMTELLKESAELSFSRAIFFQGMEGYDDVRPGYTKVAEWDGRGEGGSESFDDYEIETGTYGMEMESDDLAVEDVTADSAAITTDVLAGERDDHFADAIALNGAFRMYARQDVDSLEDGLERARDAIADGSARAVLEELQQF